MIVDFSRFNLQEQPVLILKNTTGTAIGTLGYAMNITADIKFNETSVLEFKIPAQVDGNATPYYDSVIGLRIVDLDGIGQFILVNPKETGDGVKQIKSCKAYSLEYEFTFKKITLANATYNFWNPVTPDSTLLGIILETMPSWHVGSVDASLIGKYRTFEVADENLYNFLKGTVQDSYNCIFDFDTYNREINVIAASSLVPTNPIYISCDNLAKELSVEEDTENIVTRLDVNGADGVNIRDVNPSGTNSIINLDYFMNTTNFEQSLIDKYNSWKALYQNYQLPYYNLSVEYALQIMRRATESASLVELGTELTILENEQAVVIQGIAEEISTQESLDDVNVRIAAKEAEILSKKNDISAIQSQIDSIFAELSQINSATKFQDYFTDSELLLLDRYIKDDSVSESSFVVQESDSYSDEDVGNAVANKTVSITNATISSVTNSRNKSIYDINGGSLSADFATADIIKAAFEVSQDNTFVMTAYLGSGVSGTASFPKGCISITGSVSSVLGNMTPSDIGASMLVGSQLNIVISSGFMYFTRNTSEYEKRAVAWDLFEYGKEILSKISQPSYRFDITSANFLCLEDFEEFKDKLRHGEKLYIGLNNGDTLSPICVGVVIDFDSPENLSLEFSDTYTSGDSSFLLADLLEQSVSMGKSVDLSKYTYSAFMDSGASTKVRDFMTNALDVSKNAIMSSREQAISWGDSGIRLRKWSNSAHTAYDPKQVWLNNNSILMTGDNWSTAEIAIGNFHDRNLGNCWGIVAPNIVGTLLAGSNLVIESAKQDGGVSVFKVDAEGCVLHNSNLSVTSDDTNSHILLDPAHGMVIGKYPLIDNAGNVDDSKKLFYADTNGNLTLKGTVYASAGEFTGRVTALQGYIGQPSQGWTIVSNAIYNGKPTFSNTTEGVYIGVDGISLGSSTSYIRANKNGYLLANNISVSGNVNATSGTIGGCSISGGVLKISNANITSLDASKISTGTMSADRISGGTIDGQRINVQNLSANSLTSGTINGNQISVTNLNASNIKSGTLDCGNITVKNLKADSITTGTINADRIGGLAASKITSGTFSDERIPSLNCSKISSGTFSPVQIPNLSCGKINSGSINGMWCNWQSVRVITKRQMDWLESTITTYKGYTQQQQIKRVCHGLSSTSWYRDLYLLVAKGSRQQGGGE